MRDGLAWRAPICSVRSRARWQYDAYLPCKVKKIGIYLIRDLMGI